MYNIYTIGGYKTCLGKCEGNGICTVNKSKKNTVKSV